MNCEQLLRSWRKTNNSCWIISIPERIFLFSNEVNEVIIPFVGKTPTSLLQVNNHLKDKPWKVISEFLYFSDKTNTLNIPIITSSFTIVPAGSPICHIHLMDSFHTLKKITGNFLTYQLFLIFVKFNKNNILQNDYFCRLR